MTDFRNIRPPDTFEPARRPFNHPLSQPTCTQKENMIFEMGRKVSEGVLECPGWDSPDGILASRARTPINKHVWAEGFACRNRCSVAPSRTSDPVETRQRRESDERLRPPPHAVSLLVANLPLEVGRWLAQRGRHRRTSAIPTKRGGAATQRHTAKDVV